MFKRIVFGFLLLLGSAKLISQEKLFFTLINSKTQEPVPFANILFGNQLEGTMSDINGKFDLELNKKISTIRISCLGYNTLNLTTSNLNNNEVINLEPLNIELSQVKITPGKNPALTIMENVYKNRNLNNPDKALDYSCIVYHKMAFFLDIPDSVKKAPCKEKNKLIEFNRNNYMLLIESVSEKNHIAPEKTNEKLITGRVSGLEQPVLALLPAQIQPFSFYQDHILLLNTEFINPISQIGLKQYFFLLEDTLLNEKGDTLFYISFKPRKHSTIRGMKGSMHIHAPSSAIKTVNAETIQEQSSIMLAIVQNYEQIDGNNWFPDQLESWLRISKTVTGQTFPYPLIGTGKSIVTGININPTFNKKEFTNIKFIDETTNQDLPPLNNYRFHPLSAKDSATYHVIDSIGMKLKFDAMINFQKNIIEGYIPLGYFKLDVKKIFDINHYEGLRLGIGAWTSEKISNKISTGGYYTRSLKSEDDNYGTGIRYNFSKKLQREFEIIWQTCLKEVGSFTFLDGYTPSSQERFKKHAIANMDHGTYFSTSFKTRLLQYFKTELSYQYEDVKPVTAYPFNAVSQLIEPYFTNHEYIFKIRWAHKETFVYSHFGLTSNGTKYPVIWANFTVGNGKGPENFNYKKLEGQIEKTFRTFHSSKAIIRVQAGHISGNLPATKLYSAFGTNYKNSSLETPFYFATMYPNEFAATQFTSVYLRNTFFTRINKPGKFKPEITISSSFGISDLNNKLLYNNNLQTFNKGFYESGIYFGNLARMFIFKYGFAVHYRYGPYKLPKEIDNWAFKIGLEIGL